MDVIATLRRRRTTHFFEPEGMILPREMIESMIAEACLAPSEFDLQPWRFVIVRDRERKEILYQCSHRQEMARDAAAVVIVCGDTRGHERAGEVAAEWVSQGLLAEAEAARVEAGIRRAYDGSERARLLMAIRSASFAAMSLMLLATDKGIATSPMVTFSEEQVRAAFHLPERLVPVVMVAMGMPSTARPRPARPRRLTVQQVVSHEDM